MKNEHGQTAPESMQNKPLMDVVTRYYETFGIDAKIPDWVGADIAAFEKAIAAGQPLPEKKPAQD